ncbi:accessory gene regulator B [Paenibacillus taihuensis]|uniref:Accessory gene regulator B n=1 Tax=Paenibacillus taihuensis TaxID=1156355 RepID=A0A3D9SBZ4_9BACL|nr:accessory gene regulator B family protein [Paenibacillus taihuensis]REE91413.1 accessory gene regulator B [Paenibacillus taihuensis]
MSVIVFLSKKVATAVHNANPEETSSVERLTALLALQTINFGVSIAALLIGLLTDTFVETLMAVASFAVIRLLTGGFHFSNLDVCFLVSTTGLAAIPHMQLNTYFIYILSVLSIILIAIFSTRKRVLPICIILLNILLHSPIIILAIFFQSISLKHNKR